MSYKMTDDTLRFDALRHVFRGGIDIGCGASKVLPHFVGVDSGKYYPGETHIDAECKHAEMIVSTCDELPIFADESFSVVFSSLLLDCVDDPTKTLPEWWRLVKNGGVMMLHLLDGVHSDSRKARQHILSPAKLVSLMQTHCEGWDLEVSELRPQDGSFYHVYRKRNGTAYRQSYGEVSSRKTVAIMRPGAHGDALWTASVAAHYKERGYHVTMYQTPPGAEVLRHDPHIDRLVEIVQPWWSDAAWDKFYAYESKKYDKWINLISSVETTLLPHPCSVPFFWPQPVRHAIMNVNYLERTHQIAELPLDDFRQKFYPTPVEVEWAREQRAKNFPGPLVVIAPTGSSEPKNWPHSQALIDALVKMQVYVAVLGEVRQSFTIDEKYALILGTELPIRLALALTQQADVVVGVESVIVNSVAQEDNLKVVLLSHSSHENLTKHWVNTLAVEPDGVPCYPCHRIHSDFEHCNVDPSTKLARCQSAVTAAQVLDLITPHLARERAAA